MGAALDGDDDELMSGINVTPFVDIVLVVLVIFMITSTTLQRGSFKVDLPEAAAAGETVSTTLNVVMAEDGRIALNGEVVDNDTLAARVRAEAAQDAQLRAVIAADQTVDYGRVIQLIDLVKENGVKSFALNIDRT